MNHNIAIVVGFDAEDEPHGLYVGRDFEKALDLLESQPKGIRYIALYRNVTPSRRRETEESVLIEQKRAEEAEKRAAEQRAAAEAAAKANAEAKAAEDKARIARIQAQHAAAEKLVQAEKLAKEAATLERIAAEARAKADSAAGVVTEGAAAPEGSDSSGAPGGSADLTDPATAATDDGQTDRTDQTAGEKPKASRKPKAK